MDHQKALADSGNSPAFSRRDGPVRASAGLCRGTLVALLVLAIGLGCASTGWSVKKLLREPGERLESFPDEVWEEYDCDNQKRPFFMIETNELTPRKVSSGGEFNHRLVYAMCPARPTEVVSGDLYTRIRFRGTPIVRETDDRYEIKPGRWVVDAFVELPEDAEPGIYAFEVEFRSPALAFDKSLTFLVRAP